MGKNKKIKLLNRALMICITAHGCQTDKTGQLYSFHPLQVALYLETDDEKIVGLLHDVIEDTSWTLEQLKKEFSNKNIIDAIDAITKRRGEVISDYYKRIVNNKLATAVKIADLKHNSDWKRFNLIDQSKHNIKKQTFYLSMIDTLTEIYEEQYSK